MPHGQLTPIGRQLRSVLANLSTIQVRRNYPQTQSRQFASRNGIRNFHDNTPARWASSNDPRNRTDHNEAPANEGRPRNPSEHALQQEDEEQTQSSIWRSLTLNTDCLSKAVQDAGYTIPQHPKSKRDLPPANDNSPDAPREADSEACAQVSLRTILTKYIRDEKGEVDPMRARWEPTYTPSTPELVVLREQGFTLEDVDAWSDIALAIDNLQAAVKLAQRINVEKWDPLFILMHYLGRERISAQALRTTIISISTLLERGMAHGRGQNPSLFLIAVRLIRHAREVWPQSLPSITSLTISCLQQQDAKLPPFGRDRIGRGHLQNATFALNKLMTLVSLSTALMPFKDNVFQQMAIIPILQYMDAHDPPLQITRPGYRAVVRIQLAQRKTPEEQEWAELKALSWPPWKVDRTAMDASVGLEYGITQARATLFSMRSAGYAPLRWEKAAEVYTGWDPDGTPTVQRRALLGSPYVEDRHDPDHVDEDETVLGRVLSGSSGSGSQVGKNSTYWAARIDSTRTIQEAWACYLAWEDTKQPHDQNVYLTIMQKLQEEANAHQRDESQPEQQNPAWDLLPGDTPRLSPLPPSTHLYTYTRTTPPSLDDFYRMLRAQGVQFTGHCLAFLLRNSSLQKGLARMQDSLPQHPELSAFLTLDPTHDVKNLPAEIFTAAVQVLSRSGGYFLNDRHWSTHRHLYKPFQSSTVDDDRDPYLDLVYRNKTSVMVRAIELLHRRPTCSRQTWVAVFTGLTRESNFPGLGQVLNGEGRGNVNIERDPPEEVALLGAQLAYGMTRRLVASYREQFSDLDPMAFFRYCLVTESMARSVWRVSSMRKGEAEVRRKPRATIEEMNLSGRFIDSGLASLRMREEFAALVGNMEGGDAEELFGGVKLPRLLFIPNPAMLHVYIRALGWLGDFHGLRELVLWMREFREEIEERKGRDRSGRDMFRKAIVALRVFLERAWRIDGGGEQDGGRDVAAVLGRAAGGEVVDAIREVVESVEEWEGWATDEEVGGYVDDQRFDGLRGG